MSVADGTDLAAAKLERVLTNDPGMGVIRHVDAGYDRAIEVADRPRRHDPDARGCRADHGLLEIVTTSYWCELALIDGRPQASVAIEVTAGRFGSIAAGTEPAADAIRLTGFTIPGLANVHSHAFHRALRTRTQAGRGTFWTWREQMYTAAGCLQPDSYHRIARATFAEMALAGITCVGEFHYLHHQPDGTPYSNPNETTSRLPR